LSSYIIRASEITSTTYTATGLTAGLTYKFKVEARNIYGFSDYSQEISILCASAPSVPAIPMSRNVLDQVNFDWVAPFNNGLPITSYKVMIRKSDNTFAEILDYCNGALATIILNTAMHNSFRNSKSRTVQFST